MPSKNRGRQIKTNIVAVLQNAQVRSSYTYVIKPAGEFYQQGCLEVPANALEKTYPIEMKRWSIKGELIGNKNLH